MVYKCFVFAGQEDFLSNTVHFSNVGSMLSQRPRRWPNIKKGLGECPVGVVSSLLIRLLNQPHYCMLKAYRHASLKRDSIFNLVQSGTHEITLGCNLIYLKTVSHDSLFEGHFKVKYRMQMLKTPWMNLNKLVSHSWHYLSTGRL